MYLKITLVCSKYAYTLLHKSKVVEILLMYHVCMQMILLLGCCWNADQGLCVFLFSEYAENTRDRERGGGEKKLGRAWEIYVCSVSVHVKHAKEKGRS